MSSRAAGNLAAREQPPTRFPELERRLDTALQEHRGEKYDEGQRQQYLGGRLYPSYLDEKGSMPLTFRDIRVARNDEWRIEMDMVIQCKTEPKYDSAVREHVRYCDRDDQANIDAVVLLWVTCSTLKAELKADPKPVLLTAHLRLDAQFKTIDKYGNPVPPRTVSTVTATVSLPEGNRVNWDNMDFARLMGISTVSFAQD